MVEKKVKNIKILKGIGIFLITLIILYAALIVIGVVTFNTSSNTTVIETQEVQYIE